MATNNIAQLLGYAPGALGVGGTLVGGALGSVIPGAGTIAGATLGGAVGSGLGSLLGLAGQQMQANDDKAAQDALLARQAQLDAAQAKRIEDQAKRQAQMQLLANFL